MPVSINIWEVLADTHQQLNRWLWLKADEERGLLAGVRQSRSDRGQSRVIAWRAWDRVMDSVDVPTERQQEIAAKIDLRVRSLWERGASSVRKIQMFMEHFCRDLALSAGLEAADPRLNMICRVPKNYISKPSRARTSKLIHKKRTDAGGYASDIEPRIRRTRDGMLPSVSFRREASSPSITAASVMTT